MEGKGDRELADLWRMKDSQGQASTSDGEPLVCNDGSRAGTRGLVLEEELAKLERSRM